MGEAEMILEVVDSNGNPVKVENLDVSATMPMDGMEEDMYGQGRSNSRSRTRTI